MDTKMMSQFSVMDTEMLACVEGGDIDWGRTIGCAAGIAYGAIDGYATTYGSTFLLGPYAIGTGAIGAAGGAILGGVAYAATCWW
ncbi:bacteriocin BlpO [Streptococcus pneumoniae]|uniref:Bacteriocin BlpO n=1 Tax=Streptococcus pneumoniae TaxID=1313 RepID=A0AA86Y5H8_STREE|nr:bacteriocin class II family protein [Streptococcus pneumoniae]MDH7781663.1 bacteriocin class II family protein [Streptococcus pneumoniae]CIQ01570.1 bacteriocin BlpO [Streptococcus pneumoniae]CIS43605.1 bacteriocin BlpO [Streptococcus pneumoniae]CIV64915.1 bacteriocin BlpO [Streptococcus pneumoniae]CIY89277.1 bacteriocin BlpO [Streptococcus pneumoniae]